MKINLEKCEDKYTYYCDNTDCDRSEDHMEFLHMNKTGRPHIKVGVVMAEMIFKKTPGTTSIYLCRGCIDKVYGDFKRFLNSDLWAFH